MLFGGFLALSCFFPLPFFLLLTEKLSESGLRVLTSECEGIREHEMKKKRHHLFS